MPRMSFDAADYYSRQIVLKVLGKQGQDRLKSARATVIGVGGIGSASALYLALAGVGNLVLVDQDTVELNNLHRQILFTIQDLRLPKAEVAARRLMGANPNVKASSIPDNLREENVERIIRGSDVVVDGLDNMRTRYILNSACSRLSIPYVFGGAIAMEGNVSVFHPPETPCLECILPAIDDRNLPGCDTRGVLGATAGIVGSVQAMETVKLLAGVESVLKGKLLVCDFRRMEFDKVGIFRRKDCNVCGDRIGPMVERAQRLTWLCGRETVNVNPIEPANLDFERTLKNLRRRFDVLVRSAVVIVLRHGGLEVSLFRNGRMLIKGVGTEDKALRIYRELSSFFAYVRSSSKD